MKEFATAVFWTLVIFTVFVGGYQAILAKHERDAAYWTLRHARALEIQGRELEHDRQVRVNEANWRWDREAYHFRVIQELVEIIATAIADDEAPLQRLRRER